MSIKTYASRYRNHKVVFLPGEMGGGAKGRVLEFVDGILVTDKPAEQEKIEKSPQWRRSITLVKEELTPAELKAQREAEAAAKAAAEPARKPAPAVGKGKK